MRAIISGVVAGVLVGSVVVGPMRSTSRAQPAPDIARAKDLYSNAERAMADGRYKDATFEYGEVYEITKDPVLFYKIASANEKAGACDVALTYYRRYLKEAKPSEKFIAQTHDRIRACGGDVGTGSGVPATGSAAGSAAGNTTSAEPGAGSAIEPAAPGAGSADVVPLGRNRGPWLLVGGSLAMVALGAVLAYQADAAESDLSDLYVGLEGTPPVFDARTRSRYDAVIAEGERYEKLSWVSFGLAAALGAGAALWFYKDRGEQPPVVTPAVTKDGAGVRATIRF